MESSQPEFVAFPKMPRLRRPVIISEKIDGTNAQIFIGEDNAFLVGSRNRWITPDNDNFGFARWAHEHREELVAGLGPGRHYGEWWGSGIQRGYGLTEKRFSLFNASRWCEAGKIPLPIPSNDPTAAPKMQQVAPACCHVVPVLYRGEMTIGCHNEAVGSVNLVLMDLRHHGSYAAPFMNPEGIVVFHLHSGHAFKVTLENDAVPKSKA